MANELSKEAQSALLAAGRMRPALSAVEELKAAGLIGAKGYLTARGELVRGRIARQREDEAFG